jgi:hypothetical protein
MLIEWLTHPGGSNAIAMLALILSGVGIYLGVRHNRRDRDIQRRLLAIEEERQEHQRTEARRAKLRAYLQRAGTNHYIVVQNEGEAPARAVTITLDGRPLLEHCAIFANQEEVRKIGPNSEIRYIAALDSECHPPFDFAVQWEDGSGQVGTYETTLT